MHKVLFVCLGNICRSPTAHGVFMHLVERRGLADKILVDSAGTAAWHVGKSPDPRSQEAASKRGYDLSSLRARQAVSEDFEEFDLVLAMDRSNYQDLLSICPKGLEHKLKLFLEYGESEIKEVPDPYYGGTQGFDHVLDLVESASLGLLDSLMS